MSQPQATPVSATEATSLFAGLERAPALVLAVSGGPDSTALMVLVARWREALKSPPVLVAVTVDHGLRKEAKREAVTAGKLARKLKIAHRTLRWTGKKPKTGLQQAARMARYRLLADAARKVRASRILTAHTLDDQAETMLIRMSRGSGIAGLKAMAREAAVPGDGALLLIRPLLDIPKSRLIATLEAAGISYADDPSNRDPRFTRARLRGLMPALAGEGLDARRLSVLAKRLKRADAAIEAEAASAWGRLAARTRRDGPVCFDMRPFAALAEEIRLRLLGRAVAAVGDEGPVELGKLESLLAALDGAENRKARLRRSLAGAVVTLAKGQIAVERAPPRRGRPLTKPGQATAKKPRTR